MEDVKTYINKHKITNKDKPLSFQEYFYKLLNKKCLDTKDVYKAINMSRQTFSKIINNETKPTLNNAIKLAIGLRCSNDECKLLLKKLDYTLASHLKFNLVIRYCLDNKIYNIIDVNALLLKETNKTLDY